MHSDGHPLKEIVKLNKQETRQGICSVCSANDFVLRAALRKGREDGSPVLIESTCNQVNQYGGYTGLTPVDFRERVYNLAAEEGLPAGRVILGGDHLGPNPWQDEAAAAAMEKAAEMVYQYVLAGYSKIHLDASMPLQGDDRPLSPEIIAERTARLCQVAEEAYQLLKDEGFTGVPPVYIIGSEVPTPGGMQSGDEQLHITRPEDFARTVELSRRAFAQLNLGQARKRVIGVVVQPGVEFGNDSIQEYEREQAGELSRSLANYPGLVFEGHSTDYQTGSKLREMVEDGIAILKVGPALTFAVREALFSLARIEEELYLYEYGVELSHLIERLDMAMLDDRSDWEKHYQGRETEIRLARKYSFSDRSRYYYTVPEVQQAVKLLFANIERREIPLSLLSQFLPLQYRKIREGVLRNHPLDIVIDNVINVLDDYSRATLVGKGQGGDRD